MLFLLLVAVFAQSLFPLVCSDLMSLSFFSARHSYVFLSGSEIMITLHTSFLSAVTVASELLRFGQQAPGIPVVRS
jgi:hypothetical protein